MTKQQVRMIQLALADGGKPVADREWISDGFDPQYTKKDVLYYNRGRDTKVMIREVSK